MNTCSLSQVPTSPCFFFFHLFLFLILQVQLSLFSPHHSPGPSHPQLSHLILPPLGFVHVSFIRVPWQHFSPIPVSLHQPCFIYSFIYITSMVLDGICVWDSWCSLISVCIILVFGLIEKNIWYVVGTK